MAFTQEYPWQPLLGSCDIMNYADMFTLSLGKKMDWLRISEQKNTQVREHIVGVNFVLTWQKSSL